MTDTVSTTTDRLNAELAFNANRADHEPVTDSSLTFGDLRAIKSVLIASPHKLVAMLREAEPESETDGGATLMEISVEDVRKIAWALLSEKPLQTSDTYRGALESIDAVAVDFGHFETAARTMHEIARRALFPSASKANLAISDEDRIAYWKGAYERMAARNIELSERNAKMMDALERERLKLRTALIGTGRNLGAFLADDVSSDFLTLLPEEARLLKARLARAVEVMRRVNPALSAAFQGGMEEREGGSANRQARYMESVDQLRADARAFLSEQENRDACA